MNRHSGVSPVADVLAGHRRDPLAMPATPETCWTIVNTAELFPSVPTPLTWTFWAAPLEDSLRSTFHLIGVLRRSEVPIPPRSTDRFLCILDGNVAANVNSFRNVSDRMPGTSGDAFEEQYFGAVESGLASKGSIRRYPIVAVRMPMAALPAARRLKRIAAETKQWWARSVNTEPTSMQESAAALQDSYRRMGLILRRHAMVTMLCQPAYEQLRKLVDNAGLAPKAASTLVWTGEAEEFDTVTDLWDVAHGTRTIEDFLAVHGFHGPDDGELSSRMWREDRRPLDALVTTYQGLDDSSSPSRERERFEQERNDAEQALRAGLSPVDRLRIAPVLRMVRTLMPLREAGRAAMLMAGDAARFHARNIGAELTERGVTEHPEDVFYLCLDEVDDVPVDVRTLIEDRKQARKTYQEQVLPRTWRGSPEPITVADSGVVTELTGTGASGGTVEGIARVVLSNGDSDLEPGEILVCRTTDPSWACYFFLAAGVVIDIGGVLSHGAIVARELGIPCVINARTATRDIHNGDHIRIDGDTGTVTILPAGPRSG